MNTSHDLVSTVGDYAHATATGNDAHATATGYSAHALTTGYSAHALTTGSLSNASVSGENAIAVAVGANSSARAASGGFIVLAQYDEDTVVAVKTAQVGKDGIKPDTWYTLSPTGEFVEAE